MRCSACIDSQVKSSSYNTYTLMACVDDITKEYVGLILLLDDVASVKAGRLVYVDAMDEYGLLILLTTQGVGRVFHIVIFHGFKIL